MKVISSKILFYIIFVKCDFTLRLYLKYNENNFVQNMRLVNAAHWPKRENKP